ncbi:hypothetical protein [Actinoalloteichus sp. GBA129-24]|uniref:hypothetical protein n=1 Tax=Actinoalloteichus sp. GBA129-24 TaxID=1612551 RepID=UPI0018DC1F4B|nr:hypothetical protein [Actinoalloteichus sp. GBA129-24]
MVNRRSVLHGMGGTLAAPLAARVLAAEADARSAATGDGAAEGAGAEASAGAERIDRQALVARHDIRRTDDDPDLPVQVGNGRFAFGADITGLQTFAPFATMADWGWHSDALPPGKQIEDYRGTVWDTYGRDVYYWTGDEDEPELHHWLRENPHRINLGRIGLTLTRADGTAAVLTDLTETHQHLELWTGRLHSRFVFDGHSVEVETSCDPETDAVALRVTSPLIRLGRLAVFLDFPYATAAGQDKFSAPYVGFWDRPGDHTTEVSRRGSRRAVLTHRLDETVYEVGVAWRGPARLTRDEQRVHRYHLTGGRSATLVATVCSNPNCPRPRRRSTRWSARAPTGGRDSGGPAAPWTSPARPTNGGRSWNAASCSASTTSRSTRRAASRPRSRGWSTTAGTGSSTPRCTGGTPRTTPCGIDGRCSTAAPTSIDVCSRRLATGPPSRASSARAGRR